MSERLCELARRMVVWAKKHNEPIVAQWAQVIDEEIGYSAPNPLPPKNCQCKDPYCWNNNSRNNIHTCTALGTIKANMVTFSENRPLNGKWGIFNLCRSCAEWHAHTKKEQFIPLEVEL